MNINFKDKKTWVIIGVAVLVIVVAIILIRRSKIKQTTETDGSKIKISGGLGVLETTARFPLQTKDIAGSYSAKYGSYGQQIVILQMIYNKMYSSSDGVTLDVDGKYGPNTFAALKQRFADFMESNGTITEENYNKILAKYKEEGFPEITVANKD